jgi:hypothetical protein
VVLDAGAADPTDPAVDDHDLAVIDVADPVEVPAERAAASERPEPSTELGRTHDADLDPRCRQPVVERFRAPFGIGAAAVDDEPDGDALGCLLDQRLGKGFPDETRLEAELVDVHRGRRRADVRQHRWIEVPPLDVDVSRRGATLGERERERSAIDRPGGETLGVVPNAVVRDRYPRATGH